MRLILPILMILSLVLIGTQCEVPDNTNPPTSRIDTVFVTDTVFVDRVDTVITERVDTVVVTDTIIDTVFVPTVDTVFVDRVDTVTVTETIRDTTFVTEVDTVYVPDYITIVDTVYVDRVDTLYVTEIVTDTTFITRVDTVYQPEYIYETFYDTVYVDRVDTVTVTETITETDTVFVETVDTLYIERVDTVTVTETLTDTLFIETIDTLYVDRVDTVTVTETLTDTLFVTEYDTLFIETVDTTFVTDTLYIEQTDTVFVDRIDTTYTDTLVLRNRTYSTDFTDFDPTEWEQTWGYLEYEHDTLNNQLRVTLPERSIARLQWNRVPEHTNGEYIIVEQLDSTHSTGFHVGLRHSPATEPKNSVETYLRTDSLGISIFNGGRWNNPENYVADWNYGETWITHGKLEGDVFKVRSYRDGTTFENLPEWNVYQSDLVGTVPSGRFAIGSTGAGDYVLKSVSVTITDPQMINTVDTVTVTETITDTLFVDRVDTVTVTETITETITDTLYIETVDTVYTTGTDTIYVNTVDTVVVSDTVFTSLPDTVYVDSLTGAYMPTVYGENQNKLLNDVVRSYSRDSTGTPQLTYSWNSDSYASDLYYRCVDKPVTISTYPLWRAEGHGTTVVIAHSRGASLTRTITKDCPNYLHVYIMAQELPIFEEDGNWSIRYDDYVDLARLDSLYQIGELN